MVSLLENCRFSEYLTIQELDAGLHFLLQVKTALSDAQLTEALEKAGIRIRALSEYYHENKKDRHCLVVNYSGIKEENLQMALDGIEIM